MRFIRILALPTLLLAALACPAAEPEQPAVNPTGSPEVTDPDLKEAVPAMRQGTDEPVGGFQPHRRRGSNALTIGYSQVTGFGDYLVGWRYWMGERFAVQAALGGSYFEQDKRIFQSGLTAEAGFRWAYELPVEAVMPFVDLRGLLKQHRSYTATQAQMSGFVQRTSIESMTQDHGIALRTGAEFFWPGSRRASLEASYGLVAKWSQIRTRTVYAGDPSYLGVNSDNTTDTQSFGFAGQLSDILAAVNIYF